MVDHDQQFKELLREYVWELIELFLPSLSARLAVKVTDWQSQEVFTNPPLGLVRRVDLLAVLSLRAGESATQDRVLHVEIESAGSLGDVRKKIGYYYPALRTKHNLPVTTLALYLYVGLEGVGWDEYVEEEDAAEGEEPEPLYRVRWRYVGLPGLAAERYLTSGNWLGVALSALMRIEPERKPWLRAEILRRLALECKEYDYRRLLLIKCVETYLPMEGEQELTYERLVSGDPRYQEATKMILTTFDKGKIEGKVEGKREALQDVVIRLASRQCGLPDEGTRKKILDIEDVARLEDLIDAAATAKSWEQLLASE